MSVTSFILRASGNVALSDNSNETFLALYNPFGDDFSLSVNGNEAFRINYPSKKSEIEGMDIYSAASVLSEGAIAISSDPSDSGVVVSSLAMVVTGRVTFSDNTQHDFSYEVRDDGSVYNHVEYDDEGNEAWASIAGEVEDTAAATKEIVTNFFENLYSTDADPITITLTT